MKQPLERTEKQVIVSIHTRTGWHFRMAMARKDGDKYRVDPAVFARLQADANAGMDCVIRA